MSAKRFEGPILAVHPTWRGFGWVIFEGVLAPADWGHVSAQASRHGRLMARFERLLDRYNPSAVVFEEFERGPAGRTDRIRQLYRAMIHLASSRGMETPVYSRETVRLVFASVGATTRYEIAQAIAQHIPVFRRRLPSERKPWMNERPGQSLFDAAALAITYFAVRGDAPPWC